MKLHICRFAICWLLIILAVSADAAMQRYQLVDSLSISPVWAGDPVDFSFIARGDNQYMTYYDKDRNMTIAKHVISTNSLQKMILPSVVGWDSHNFISTALDVTGNIHVSGNMHVNKLVYFRSTSPGDISTVKAANMVGTLENAVTYPEFFDGPNSTLVFDYRNGTSGNGQSIFNQYDATPQKWTRLLDTPLFDGQGTRNAYFGGPFLGPDGYFHIYYCWRESSNAGSNHDIGYIKSKDLINWVSVSGAKLSLPITISTPNVIIDPIPQNSGTINRGAIGFDSKNRVIVTYQKYDTKGNTQVYNARWEGSAWNIVQTSNWSYRWVINASGALVFDVTFGPVVLHPNGSLTQEYYQVKVGTGLWQLDPLTLKPSAELGSSLWPVAMEPARRSGMVVNWLKCANPDPNPATVYALRWETMPTNGDTARATIPSPSPMVLYKFLDPNVSSAGIAKRDAPMASFRVNCDGGGSITVHLDPSMSEVSYRLSDLNGMTVSVGKLNSPATSIVLPVKAPRLFVLEVLRDRRRAGIQTILVR